MFILNEKPLQLDIPFEHNGIQYPANWLRLSTLEEKQEIGISEAPDTPWHDDRFYWGIDNPKDLDMLKTHWTAQFKQTAGQLLAQSDWMIIRKIERNVDIPEEITDFRADVITESNRLDLAIADCETVEDLIAVVIAPQWPTTGIR